MVIKNCSGRFVYSCTIEVKTKKPAALYRALLPEIEVKKTDRVKTELNKRKNSVSVKLRAEDPVVLRATVNSLTRLLSVWHDLETKHAGCYYGTKPNTISDTSD